MTYEGHHTEDMCDKCGKNIGKENLKKVPFLYLDCNDKKHPDMSYLWYKDPCGYRQYYVCVDCYQLVKPVKPKRRVQEHKVPTEKPWITRQKEWEKKHKLQEGLKYREIK